MKTDEEIKNDWKRIDEENLKKACEYLSKLEGDIENYIADIVASICSIDVNDMFKNTSVAYIARPRWLYWYAIRYLTNETYEKIAARTKERGFGFDPNGIGQSINKMSSLINKEPIWMKRWTIIKHIIKLRDLNNDDDTIVMRVIAPKGIKVELKRE